MAQTDLAGLLTGITQAPIDPMAGASMAQRQLAMGAQAAQGLRQGMGGLFNTDTRTTKEKADQMLSSLDINKPEEREQIFKIISNVNPAALPALRESLAQQDAAREQQLLSNKQQQEALDISRISATRGSSSPYGFGRSYVVRDKDGNLYNVNAAMSKQAGSMETIYSPITPNAPAQPTGELTMVSGEFGQSFQDEITAAGEEVEAKTFGELRGKASEQATKTGEALITGNRMLGLLSDIETGGFTETSKKAIFDVFGVTPTSVSEFENLAGQMMLDNLKAFGANPTEGERAVAASLQASIDKGEGVNKAIIEKFIAEMQRKQARLQYLTLPTTKNLQSYNNYVNSQYATKGDKTEVTDPTVVIDLSALPD
jgi:hypothetical protein